MTGESDAQQDEGVADAIDSEAEHAEEMESDQTDRPGIAATGAGTGSFKLSRAETFTLLAGVFGVLPLLFCAMRIMAVSRGNLDTLRSLVQNLDVKALILATILPIGGTVIFWTQILLLMFAVSKRTRPEYKRLVVGTAFYLLPFTVAVLWAATPKRQVVINGLILFGFFLLIIVGAKVRRIQKAVVVLCAVALLIWLFGIVITILVQDDMWLPFERIKLVGNVSVDGYVLSADGEWTRFMDSQDNRVHIVPSNQLVSRILITD